MFSASTESILNFLMPPEVFNLLNMAGIMSVIMLIVYADVYVCMCACVDGRQTSVDSPRGSRKNRNSICYSESFRSTLHPLPRKTLRYFIHYCAIDNICTPFEVCG